MVRFTLQPLYAVKKLVSQLVCRLWNLISLLFYYATVNLSFSSQDTFSTLKQLFVTTSTQMRVYWYMALWFCIVAKTETLSIQTQDTLLRKGTKHQLSLFDKMPMVHRFFHACFTFQFRPCTIYRRKVWIKDDKWDSITLGSNRSLLATLWCHTFPNLYGELQIPNWNTPLMAIISNKFCI